MIKQYSLAVLQKAINHALTLDESMSAKIQALEGKVLEIIISPLDVSFFIQFSNGKLELDVNNEKPADTTIRSSPLGFIRLSILPASKTRSLFNDDVQISGDVELGQQVKKIFDDMDIDWEGHLARFTGDVVAYQVGSIVRRGLSFTRQIQTSMRQNLTEYMQEELRIFPPREEVEDFFKDIDELSLQIERLIARFQQLQGSANEAS